MADIGEEFDLDHVEFVHAMLPFAGLTYLKIDTRVVQHEPTRQEQCSQHTERVQHKGSLRAPKRRKHRYLQLRGGFVPDAVIVGCFYFENVFPGIEVSIGYASLQRVGRRPLLAEPLP